MPWVRLDDGMYTHRKLVDVSVQARWLLVASVCYANQNATDGKLSQHAAETVGMMRDPDAAIEELLAVVLWERDGAGYRIHDYHQYQPTREKILADRAANASRQARHRARNGSNGVTDAVTDGVTGL
jgi:hypothetical protein